MHSYDVIHLVKYGIQYHSPRTGTLQWSNWCRMSEGWLCWKRWMWYKRGHRAIHVSSRRHLTGFGLTVDLVVVASSSTAWFALIQSTAHFSICLAKHISHSKPIWFSLPPTMLFFISMDHALLLQTHHAYLSEIWSRRTSSRQLQSFRLLSLRIRRRSIERIVPVSMTCVWRMSNLTFIPIQFQTLACFLDQIWFHHIIVVFPTMHPTMIPPIRRVLLRQCCSKRTIGPTTKLRILPRISQSIKLSKGASSNANATEEGINHSADDQCWHENLLFLVLHRELREDRGVLGVVYE